MPLFPMRRFCAARNNKVFESLPQYWQFHYRRVLQFMLVKPFLLVLLFLVKWKHFQLESNMAEKGIELFLSFLSIVTVVICMRSLVGEFVF